MAVNTPVSGPLQAVREFNLKVGIGSAEGVDALARILAAGLRQVAVSTMDLRPAIVRAQVRRQPAVMATEAEEETRPTPAEPAADSAGHDLTRIVIESWEQTLGRTRIGVDDNFFELGGDSLTALQVITLLKTRLGREIPVVTFYEAPTVGLLARALGEKDDAKPAGKQEGEQRAGTRLELMQRRRQQRGGQPALDPSR